MSTGGMPTKKCKLVLLGDQGVGKSCLVLRLTSDQFSTNLPATVGAAFQRHLVHLSDVIISMDIWDTAGQERYRSLSPMYYRGASAALVVFSVTCADSFQRAKSWVQELDRQGQEKIVICLTANKSDLTDQRVVSREEADAYAKENNLMYRECSAKTGTGVQDIFVDIARTLAGDEYTSVPDTTLQKRKQKKRRFFRICGD
eukprot:Sspe_Gene.75433::Locus_47127_Transcript_1_1_Confidence_1.000_Length_761::g.75433::m.75433/K07889/RAB5C; Ras-related protein Rab-5C